MVLVDTHQHALALASAEASQADRLSPREGEILYWASQGKTYHDRADPGDQNRYGEVSHRQCGA